MMRKPLSAALPRLAALTLLISALGGCMLNPVSEAADPAAPAVRPAADLVPELEALFPDLLAQAGEGSPIVVAELRETSCLDSVQDEHPNAMTSALAWALGRFTDHAPAQEAVDAFAAHLSSEGWALENEVRKDADSNGVVHVLSYTKSELTALVRYRHAAADGHRVVDVTISSPCVENSLDHRMIRSKLDPDYGVHSRFYDHEAEAEAR